MTDDILKQAGGYFSFPVSTETPEPLGTIADTHFPVYTVVSLAKEVAARHISPIIHYVAYNGRHLVGILTGIEQDTEVADLVIFTNMENVNGEKNFGMQFHQKVVRSEEEKCPGTWHAPCVDAYHPISRTKEETHGA